MTFWGLKNLSLIVLVGTKFLFAEGALKTASLEVLKSTAVLQNAEVQTLEQSLKELQATEARTSAPFYPVIGIAGGTEYDSSREIKKHLGVGYIYGDLNLFRGFSDAYRLEIAGLEVKKAATRFSRSKFRIGLEVEEAYYQILFLNSAIELRNKALIQNEGHKKYARKRKDSGLVSDSDVMEFDLREAIIRSDIASLEQQREGARIQLRQILGLESETELEPTGKLGHWHLKSTLEELKKILKTDNETILIANSDLKIAETESKLWQTRLYPEIDAMAKAGYLLIDDNRPQDGDRSVRGLIVAKIDIFSGFDTRSQRREGISRFAKAEARLKQAVLSSGAQLEATYKKIKATESRIHLEELNEVRAQRYYTAVMKEYRRGIKNSADVKSAAEGYFDASLRRESFRYDFVIQKTTIEKLLGSPISIEVVRINHEVD